MNTATNIPGMPFDPDTFMNQNVDQPLAENFTPIPTGDYQMMVGDFDRSAFGVAKWTDKQSGEEREQITFECPMVLQAPEVAAKMQRDKLVSTYRMFIDLDATGQIDASPDKNVKLGRLRKALGQNNPGLPWNFNMLKNQGPVMGRIGHREDKHDKERKFAEVVSVAPMTAQPAAPQPQPQPSPAQAPA